MPQVGRGIDGGVEIEVEPVGLTAKPRGPPDAGRPHEALDAEPQAGVAGQGLVEVVGSRQARLDLADGGPIRAFERGGPVPFGIMRHDPAAVVVLDRPEPPRAALLRRLVPVRAIAVADFLSLDPGRFDREVDRVLGGVGRGGGKVQRPRLSSRYSGSITWSLALNWIRIWPMSLPSNPPMRRESPGSPRSGSASNKALAFSTIPSWSVKAGSNRARAMRARMAGAVFSAEGSAVWNGAQRWNRPGKRRIASASILASSTSPTRAI